MERHSVYSKYAKANVRPRGVMLKTIECLTAVCEFVLQSLFYVDSQTNTTGKDMNPLALNNLKG